LRILLTGSAGFIGSKLSFKLLKEGIEVVGVDNFYPNYDRKIKLANLNTLLDKNNFTFYELSLDSDIEKLDFNNIDAVFHLSALPGVRKSWGESFFEYTNNNIIATQQILEKIKKHPHIRIVYASSSSIYGETEPIPFNEKSSLPNPKSPYGVTKLAGEHLFDLYSSQYGIESTILRLFTVYGPHQRPDMAFHRFLLKIHREEKIEIYGSLEYYRDYTYIDDVVTAFINVLENDLWGEKLNIGSSKTYSLGEILDLMGEITNKSVDYEVVNDAPGDVKKTYADIFKAKELLGYEPKWNIKDGLIEEHNWIKKFYGF
jgi:UDP-glucose 4-epimerase